MSYSTLELAIDGGIATITLNRPEKRNAISYDLIADLLRALEEVKNSAARVLILTGAGKAFCSGMDLDDLKSLIGARPSRISKTRELWSACFGQSMNFPSRLLRLSMEPLLLAARALRCCAISRWLCRKPSLVIRKFALDLCLLSFQLFCFGRSEKKLRVIFS